MKPIKSQMLVAAFLTLSAGFAHAAEIRIKNCADHKISVTIWNRNDNDKVFSSGDGNIDKEDTKKFKCDTKKCQVAAGDAKGGVHVAKEQIFEREARGDVRIEFKNKTYQMKDGHTCDK